MFGSRFVSISVKLAVIIAVLLIILVPLSNWMNIRGMAKLMEENLANKARALTSTVAANCANAIVGGDFNFLRSAVHDTMTDDEDAVYGIIVNKENRVLVYLEKGKAEAELETFHLKEMTDERSKSVWEKASKPNQPVVMDYKDPQRRQRILEVARPIFVGETRWGAVRFGFGYVTVEAAQRAALLTSVVTTLAFVAVGIAVAYVVSRTITRPIKQLVQDAATIAQGNLEKEVTISSTDEIGILAHAFEKMRTSLRLQFREVAKKAMGLEGELDVFALPDLLQLVCSSVRTGRLVLEGEQERGYIYVNRGEIVHADLSGGAGKFEGNEAVYRFFNWTSGAFKFEPMDLNGTPRTITVGWQYLIMEGARQTDEMGRIKQVIPSDDCFVSVVDNPPEGVEEIQLTVEELQVSMLVQGRKRVAEVVHDSSFEEFDTYQMLYRLVSAGLLKVEGR